MEIGKDCGADIWAFERIVVSLQAEKTTCNDTEQKHPLMDKLTPEQRHRNMTAVKSKGTKPEKLLAKSLWAAGLRYRKNDKTVFGHPDFVHKGKKIAIFCDGEMWHGKDWEHRRQDFKSHRDFWIPKIERNIQRDKEVNDYLVLNGWTVLRFWETDIIKNTNDCIEVIKEAYRRCKQ